MCKITTITKKIKQRKVKNPYAAKNLVKKLIRTEAHNKWLAQ